MHILKRPTKCRVGKGASSRRAHHSRSGCEKVGSLRLAHPTTSWRVSHTWLALDVRGALSLAASDDNKR
jgi:hypothetical protein